LLHSSSAIGVELDSLADMVSFGLVPSVAMFTLYGLLPQLSRYLFQFLQKGVHKLALLSFRLSSNWIIAQLPAFVKFILIVI
jgi:phosphatidylserine synthase